ncbi:chorismate synthase [Zongyangia hominis]|uniref:Chorismate synthase n=1 Tax=Zongyangia hominis TaxID=2763677 RepID=A0A926EDM2_9FIRM|nr:chorismate synthase [Zongyangia hominis]MBC8571150.1 chorismate synthase [Zongyangia hominis]
MSSVIDQNIKVSIFGESHSPQIGVVMDNLPAGLPIDMDRVLAFMARRAPQAASYSTARREADVPQVVSGLFEGHTTGTPLCALIANTDTRSKDYEEMRAKARPGHADFTGFLRYHGQNDYRGGGHFSGRLTAPLCFAGAVALQALEGLGVTVGAHILSLGGVWDNAFDPVDISAKELRAVSGAEFPVTVSPVKLKMLEAVEEARKDKNSLGGTIECCAVGVRPGLGSPMFDGLENVISRIVFGIPAVKGIEFGSGFDCAGMTGREHNDPFYMDENGMVKTKTNNHGGILGGISSGMPLIFRVAVKPTPSIASEQDTVDFVGGKDEKIAITGRHDPCVVPRAVPCVEAALALGLLDAYLAPRPTLEEERR